MPRHLLTGAGSGIGAALADRLLARGDELVLLARTQERADELRARFRGAETFALDLAEPTAVDALTDVPERLDSVVHAAGVVDLGPVSELDTDTWIQQLTVNLVAPAVLTRRLLPALRAARGTVVLVNSGAGLVAHPDWSAYAASKHGLRALADALRAEEQRHGVRVTSIFPGRTATPMQEKVHTQEGKTYDPDAWIRPDTVVDVIVHVLDLPPDAVLPEVVVKPR